MKEDARRGGVAAIAAGALVAVALLGPLILDASWLALAPAAALLIIAARELHAAWRPRDGRLGVVGSVVLAVGAGALLALMVMGIVATTTLGLEPAWIDALERVAGYSLIVGLALFGIASMRTRLVPRWAGLMLAVSLPLGLAADTVTKLFPFGELFVFAGFGFYLGMGLFALSLVRLGVAARGVSGAGGT